MEDIDKLKETFYQEADDILNNLDELLLQLENNPGNRRPSTGYSRNMHTLKGSSGIFEFHSVERLAHAVRRPARFYEERGCRGNHFWRR